MASRSIERLSPHREVGTRGLKVLEPVSKTVEDMELSRLMKIDRRAREKLREVGYKARICKQPTVPMYLRG